MTQVRAPDIATKEEVLETFTQLMRGEKTAEQMKEADTDVDDSPWEEDEDEQENEA